jgi:hypothetical protein
VNAPLKAKPEPKAAWALKWFGLTPALRFERKERLK